MASLQFERMVIGGWRVNVMMRLDEVGSNKLLALVGVVPTFVDHKGELCLEFSGLSFTWGAFSGEPHEELWKTEVVEVGTRSTVAQTETIRVWGLR